MFILPEFVLVSTLKEALTEIANDSDILEQLFSQFEQPYLEDIYGKKEIDSIKEYFEKDQIKVVNSFRLIDSEYPCYSIQLINNEEIDAEALLDDFGCVEFLDENGNVVQKNPASLTGPGFPVSIPDHDSKRDVYAIPVRENIMIGCHAADKPNITRFMSWMLQYILRSKKNTLIARGINRISMSFSDFSRANELLPENIFTRFCTLSCVHYLTFSEDDLLLDDSGNAIDLQVKAQIRSYANSPGTTDKELPENATFITIEG